MSNQIPSALLPAEPTQPTVPNFGGPADVQSTVSNLQSQLIANPVPAFGEQRYNEYKQQISMHNPGLPPDEIERMSLEAAQRDVDGKAASELAAQNSLMAKNQKAEEMNAKRLQLGLAPMPGMAPAAPQAPDVQQFAKPEQQASTIMQPAAVPSLSIGGIAGTFDKEQKANQAIANAMVQKNGLEEMAVAEYEDKLAESQLRQEKIKADFDTIYAQRTSELDNISKQLASQDFTTGKVDSNRLFNNMGTGQKILAGIALALGGYGGALTGKGDNKALEVINSALDRDIQEQKFNIQQDMQSKQLKNQNLKDRANMEQSMLSNLRSKYGDDTQAELAFRTLALQRTQAQVNRYALSSNSKQVQAQAQALNAQIERQKIVTMQELQAKMAQQQLLKSLGSQDVSQLTPVQMAGLPKEMREALERQGKLTVPGLGLALDEEAAKKARQIKAGSDGLISNIDEILQIRKTATKADLANPYSKVYMRLKSLSGELTTQKKEASELGALDLGVKTLVDQIYANPTGFNPNIDSTYQSSKKMQIKLTQQKLAPYVGQSTAKKYSGPTPMASDLKTLKPD